MRDQSIEALAEHPDDWWMRGRTAIVTTLLAKYPRATSICDVGAGSGEVALGLRQSGFSNITTVDASERACSILRSRGFTVHRLALPTVNLTERFDIVLLLDVLEHVREDEQTLNNLRQIIKPTGRLILTVPAFPWLWSAKDKEVMHQRRYRRSELRHKLLSAGYRLNYLTYYNCWLFLPALIFTLINKRRARTARYASNMDKLFYPIFASERHLIKKGRHFPIGVSLLAIAEPNE